MVVDSSSLQTLGFHLGDFACHEDMPIQGFLAGQTWNHSKKRSWLPIGSGHSKYGSS